MTAGDVENLWVVGGHFPEAARCRACASRTAATESILLLLRSAFLRRDLSTGFSRLRQSDGYRLLAAGRFLSRPAALQSSAFPLVHRLPDLLLCLLAVSGHFFSPLCKTAARQVPELRARQMVLISRFTFHNREEKP